ncbi:MAG: hypothetical protein GY851_08235 [bacterium]|nr:hypothetical protein [bacterium]
MADVDGDGHSELVVPLDTSGSIDCDDPDPEFAGLRCGETSHCFGGSCTDAGLCECATDAGQCGDRHGCVDGVCKAVVRPRRAGIEVLRDTFDNWAPSRPVWNQHAYHVTNVSDDGQIPKTSDALRNWEVDGLNNFRQNLQQGAAGISAPDLTVGNGAFSDDCTAQNTQLTLSARACNRGTASVAAGVEISFFPGDPASTTAVCTTTTSGALQPSTCESISCIWNSVPLDSPTDITVVADSAGAIVECHENNSTAVVKGAVCPSS